MIRHVVMYTIKDEHKHRIPELVNNFCAMKGKIPGLLEVESGGDELHSERSYDLILITVLNPGRLSRLTRPIPRICL